MTNFLRHLSRKGLLLVAVAAVLVLAAGTALAAGALSGPGAKPPAEPLGVAVHDALAAKPVAGVTARIRFTNKLVGASGLQGASSPLLAGATGRLWAAPDGRLRLELQSDRGDVQVTSDGKTLTAYDATSNTLYRVALPAHRPAGGHHPDTPPTLKAVQDAIARVAGSAGLSGAIPSNVAGRPAYTVRVTPRHGGLVGGAELAWDAATGAPLRAAVYAAGNARPALELTATDISFGPVAGSVFTAPAPHGARVVDVQVPSKRAAGRGTGAGTPPFKPVAPDRLAGMARTELRVGRRGVLVTYGTGLGGIAVLERPAKGTVTRRELKTALGTLVRFERGGIEYTVVGSVPAATAEAAARAL